MIRRLITLVALVLVASFYLVEPVYAQAGVVCTPQMQPAQVTFGRTNITFQSDGHAENDPAGQPKITDYFGEIRVRGVAGIVTTFTIPKTSVTPVTGAGIPPNCFQTLLPAMAGLLPSAVYTLTFYARNTTSSPPQLAAAPETADFFLQAGAAPRSPARLSFVTAP